MLNYFIKTFTDPVDTMFVHKFRRGLFFVKSPDALANLLKFMAGKESLQYQDEITLVPLRQVSTAS